MKTIKRRRNPAIQKRINILKARGYRGFRITGKEVKTGFSIEVGAYNKMNDRVIASGRSTAEAYENLIRRIDETLDA